MEKPRVDTILDCLEYWVTERPDQCLFSFLDVDGKEKEGYSYLGFQERTRHLAQHLSRQVGLKRGDRVLLVYPPGLEIIVAFFACARIGVIPVPVYPPTPMNFEAGLAKLAFVAGDCEATAALTTRDFLQSYRLLVARRRLMALWRNVPRVQKLEWVTSDDVRGIASDSFNNDPGPILFLQYTSGSTSDPKGVIVSHENVIHNARSTLDHSPTGVSWLPQYHDMGLIGYYLFPAITGGTNYGFAPLDFLKRPALWLQTISRVRGTYASSPNFGYEYCVREDKVPTEQIQDIDLSTLRVLMNAAEPVRCETYTRFFQRFAPHGLRPEAYIVAYGLAENTLAVSNYGKQILTVNKSRLQQRKLRLENGQPRNNNQIRIVSCGKPLDGVEVRIVDPDSRAALGERQVGEIWLAGKSKCRGYWKRPDLTREVFGATVSNDSENHAEYVRTGDLGFFYEGELFVCGRIKDLIIIRGVNYYPQDIESIVEAASPKIRRGGVAAFQVDGEGEDLVVVAEVRTHKDLPDPVEIARAVRTQYYVEPHTIAFVPSRTIIKTTSGKTARGLTRQRWLDGELPVIASHVRQREPALLPASTGLRERFQYLIEMYNLTGREEYSFAEIGIDSLTMVLLIEDIKELLEEHGAAELVDEVDVKLLQRLTIAELFSLLDRLEAASDQSIVALSYALRRIRQEHVTCERERMRSDAELEPLSGIEVSASDGPLRSVLLTGATGYFGPFLLSSLLRRTPYTFHVLTRATDPIHGMDRIRAALHRARIWTPVLDEELEKRVRICCGDLTRPRLGLTADQWESLALRVQAVCHNAAWVNYVMGYEAMRPSNVDGTRELLRLAFTAVRKEFHLVSSTFIFGWSEKETLFESDINAAMADLDFGYAQTKWVAEQLVFAAQKQGLEVRVYRPSLISASTGGVGSRDDIAVRLLAFMINHGIAVNARNQISFLPADIAADNIAAIFAQRQIDGRTLHVTADTYYNLMDITRTITRLYGFPFAYYDIPRFVKEMNRRCTKDDLVFPLLDFFNRSHVKISAMQHKRYHNELYRRAREQAGTGWSEPALAETVSYLMDFMLREGIVLRTAAGLTAKAEASA